MQFFLAHPVESAVWSGFHNNSSDLTHLNSGFLGRLRTTYDRQDNKRVENDCGPVSMPKDSIRTRVVTFDTAKDFIIPIETLFA